MTKRKNETYFLHVHADGREQHFVSKPSDLPCLRVDIVERDGAITEKTWTKRVPDGGTFKVVQPRGEGWVKAGNDGGSNVWLRKREI